MKLVRGMYRKCSLSKFNITIEKIFNFIIPYYPIILGLRNLKSTGFYGNYPCITYKIQKNKLELHQI